jgi:opacity protein-like surface antigen
MRYNRVIPSVILLFGLSQPSLLAQDPPAAETVERYAEEAGFLAGFPTGEFGSHVSTSAGLGSTTLHNIDKRGIMGLRVDGYYLLFDSETRMLPPGLVAQLVDIAPPYGSTEVTTENKLYSLLAGPQIGFRSGAVRGFVNGGIGITRFATESYVEVCDPSAEDGRSEERNTNFAHYTFAWASGGGLEFDLGSNFSLLLATQYLNNGTSRYVKQAELDLRPDGAVDFLPTESEANLVVLQIQLSYRFGGSR